MSDITVAPAATPAAAPTVSPAPAPAPKNEAVVNVNPTSTPTPIGPQAPPAAPEPEKAKADSRRESIKRAFDRAKDGEDKPRPKPGIGHNQPPEAIDKEKAAKPQQPREQGRFVKAAETGQPPGQSGQPGQQQPGQPQAGQQPAAPRLPETAPYRDPPPRMAEHARAEWAAAPESIRGEVHRMVQETDGLHRRYRGDHETMNSIRHFHEMATQHGTTLDRALENYTGMERKLRTDVLGGLDIIVNNLDLKSADGQKLTFRDLCYHYLNQSPEQQRLIQHSNAQNAQSHQIGALHQTVQTLAQSIQQLHHEKQFTQTRSSVDAFADLHPRFDELGELIEQELKFGFDLETAYRRAEMLRPGSPTHAAQTRNPSAQTRPDKSLRGVPDTPSNGDGRTNSKPVGRREAIQHAMRRVNAGV